MVKREPFTPEEEVLMLNFVYSKIEHALKYDLKPSRMATDKAWIELARRPGMTRTAESYESHYRKHMKVRLYSIQGVDTGPLLAIGKAHGVSMSDRIKRAFEKKHSVRITLAGGKIDSWEGR
ncbi:hypothetical protein CAEBREN_22290 [Caenorhabditis brenneri]|uniref:Myb-like domain-containing protein n=1 Tax=Caenorhabditis brenneri TaxID=135651 RepID=G0NAG1_CAEBE|nr:hypothetical protein CAEBREN_22290 [Caenorhabditis brenneri]